MAVYTAVAFDTLDAFLGDYQVGALLDFEGIQAGIENTNYFVRTEPAEYVLTVFETMAARQLRPYLMLMAHLADFRQLSARPIGRRDGELLAELGGKPACLVERLRGRSIEQPNQDHCTQLGRTLARLHLASQAFEGTLDTVGEADSRQQVISLVQEGLTADEKEIAKSIAASPDLERDTALPGGIIHADLFRDNALFEGDDLSGLIDFYYAHRGPYIYDLAVVAADWCFMPTLAWRWELLAALFVGYNEVRALADSERQAWPQALEAAAGRFWLSRLRDMHQPRQGQLTMVKDPQPFLDLLRWCRGHREELVKALG